MENQKKFFVTTPIYYVTAKPHLGSLYSTLMADVITRWHKLMGEKTFFLTGTDEHGQKIAQAAMATGKNPQEFVDSFIASYRDAWDLYGIEYSKFIRTTDAYHKKGVLQAVQKMLDKGAIYKSLYEGWYCISCETFVPEKEQHDRSHAPSCPTCGRQTVEVSEETYFFKLSAYQEKLLQFYKEHPDFIVPHERANEVLSFVNAGLHDLSISRTTIKWGIPFPEDPTHVIYVWVDALLNYLTGVGYGSSAQAADLALWWAPDVQILGKDIIRFHAVFWPAFLMALDLPLPKQLLVHGWIKVDKEKMSKSLGNVVDPIDLFKKYGADPVRYYLLRQLAINQDGEFSITDLEQRISSDLANDLGNLLQRTITLALKHNMATLTPPATWSEATLALQDQGWDLLEEVQEYMSDYSFHMALASVWKFIHHINSYFHAHEPWKLMKTNPTLAQEILSATAHGLRMVAIVLWPIMPKKMEELLHALGCTLKPDHNYIEELNLNRWHYHFTLQPAPLLFTKPEEESKAQEREKAVENQEQYIAIDDLVKVKLAVGTIQQCEPIVESEKLLKLQVDFGDLGHRQILAGVRKSYNPEELIGKQAVFVVNLKPRKMLGYESQGMLLVANDQEQQARIVSPAGLVPNGTQLK